MEKTDVDLLLSWKLYGECIAVVGGIDGSVAVLNIRNIISTSIHESIKFLCGV